MRNLTLAVKADDTDLDVALRRKVFDEAYGARRAIILGITAAQALRGIHDEHDVEKLHATDGRGNTFNVDARCAVFHGVACRGRLDLDLQVALCCRGRTEQGQQYEN